MNIRSAQPEDALAISEIRVAAWQSAYRTILPGDYLQSLDPASNLDGLSRLISERSLEFLVAMPDSDSPICGFSISGVPRYEAPVGVVELWALNVSPASWGRGIGRALVSACLDSAAQAENELVELWVLSKNQRAIRMYESAGFLPTGRDRSTSELTGHPLHELCYSYSIAQR